MPPRLAIIVGGKNRGGNMAAIIRAIPHAVAVIIGPAADAPALLLAKELGAETAVVEPGDDYGARLLAELDEVEVLCLAGFMRLLPMEVLHRFEGRVLNIHPALLPKFGGKGMYGMHVHRAVLAAGEKESGCTIHVVTEHYDEGPIVLQKRCPVFPEDTPESLSARVAELEHQAYPEAIQRMFS